jgi:hypothetical protein
MADSSGIPFIVMEGSPPDTATVTASWAYWLRVSWRDSTWTDLLRNSDGAGLFAEPVVTPGTASGVVALGPTEDSDGYNRVLLRAILPDRFTPAETVLVTPTQDTEYGGAAQGRRRWICRGDQFPNTNGSQVRVAYSDTVGIWHEFLRQGIDDDLCSIAPLSDSSAMLSFAGRSGLAWVLFEGSRQVTAGYLDTRPYVPIHPRLRLRPSGGLWLFWSDRDQIHISSYRDGVWQYGDSIRGIHDPTQTYAPGWLDASLRHDERPVLAWGDFGYGYTYRDIGSAAFPTDSGWTAGEEIPGSENIFTTPTVAVDMNGDAWFAWDLLRIPRVFYTHTYVSVVPSAPTFAGSTDRPNLQWPLSGRAPASWWAILRAAGDGDFSPIARLRANSDTVMSYTDSTAPPGLLLRYAIRRECVDKRYELIGPEATWWPRTSVLSARLSGANPATVSAEVTITGAQAGALDVRLYDLQGRLVLRQRPRANGSGQDALSIPFDQAQPRLGQGIYFLKVIDSAGHVSESLKIAVVQ